MIDFLFYLKKDRENRFIMNDCLGHLCMESGTAKFCIVHEYNQSSGILSGPEKKERFQF